jgi:two-component system OmpR family response regulator
MIMCPMPRTILVVDDDPHIRQLLVFALAKAGLDSIEACDGEDAIAQVSSHAPDLVILDINMPRMDGLEVCRRLRAAGDLPSLFLSSRDDEIDRVLGIELGGDDYVVKPFSPREVVARAMAILRRTAGKPAAEKPAAEGLRHGDLALDTDAWSASWDGRAIALTVTEFTILRTLAAAPARIHSRDMIIDRLHGPGFAVTDRTIDSHVRNLRRKFADAGCDDLIETRAGLGYLIGRCRAKPDSA